MYHCTKCNRKHHEYSELGRKHAKYMSKTPVIRRKKNPDLNIPQEVNERRKDFHGSLPDRVVEVEIESDRIPSHLIVLGACTKVSYIPLGTTDKEDNMEYVHEFGDWGSEFHSDTQPLLCCDSSGKHLYLIGGKYFVGKTNFSREGWIYG